MLFQDVNAHMPNGSSAAHTAVILRDRRFCFVSHSWILPTWVHLVWPEASAHSRLEIGPVVVAFVQYGDLESFVRGGCMTTNAAGIDVAIRALGAGQWPSDGSVTEPRVVASVLDGHFSLAQLTSALGSIQIDVVGYLEGFWVGFLGLLTEVPTFLPSLPGSDTEFLARFLLTRRLAEAAFDHPLFLLLVPWPQVQHLGS